jgi:hypothetical protein
MLHFFAILGAGLRSVYDDRIGTLLWLSVNNITFRTVL